MGAIDLVVQIEAPPSVASGLQRIGRAGHRIDEVSTGIIFPKFRGDLVACAAVTRAMMRGEVEPSRYPRNPLDVLAQQIVAMVAVETVGGRRSVCDAVRGAAPYAELEPARLRGRARHAVGPLSLGRVRRAAAARHVGSRQRHRRRAPGRQARRHRQRRHDSRSRPLRRVPARRRARSRARRRARRRDGVRGARRRDVPARRVDVAHRADHARPRDRVARARASRARCRSGGAKPAAGRSSSASRSASWCASCGISDPTAARARLEREHGLDALAATNLLQYLDDQQRAVDAVPDDRTLLIERTQATSSATGACSCCRRSAAACTRRGRWR